jgi:hypothetical protein
MLKKISMPRRFALSSLLGVLQTIAALAGLSGFLCLATLVRKDWLEGLVGWAPDDHSGLAEWLLTAALLALALVFGVLARHERRWVEAARTG